MFKRWLTGPALLLARLLLHLSRPFLFFLPPNPSQFAISAGLIVHPFVREVRDIVFIIVFTAAAVEGEKLLPFWRWFSFISVDRGEVIIVYDVKLRTYVIGA